MCPAPDSFSAQEDDEDVVISLCSKDPQACKGVVRFDYTKGEYVPVKLTEWMIDHLEVESAVLHKDSEEAQIQMQREGANKLGKYVFSPSYKIQIRSNIEILRTKTL